MIFITALQAPAANAAYYAFSQTFSENLQIRGYFSGEDTYDDANSTQGQDGKLNQSTVGDFTVGDMSNFKIHYSGSAMFNKVSCLNLGVGECGFSPYANTEMSYNITRNEFDEGFRLALYKNAYHNGVWGTWYQTISSESISWRFFPAGSIDYYELTFSALAPMSITQIEPPIDTPVPAALWLFLSALIILGLGASRKQSN